LCAPAQNCRYASVDRPAVPVDVRTRDERRVYSRRAMTIFKEKVDEEHLTVAETKVILEELERERAANEDREMRYELARAIEHVNRFALLEPEQSREFVEELLGLEKVDEPTAYKIADLQPRDRDELRAVYAQERYSLSGDELDEVLEIVAKYV
jgi:DNA-directed RNA polymerase subunit F